MNISYSVYSSFDEINERREEWDTFVESVGGDIYLTFDWCRIWWNYYGAKRKLQLILFFNSGRLVGLLPIFVETLWLGVARIRAAKLIGSDFSLQLCNPPITSDAYDEVFSQCIRYLLGDLNCDVFIAGPLSESPDRIEKMLLIGKQEHNFVGRAEGRSNFCTTNIDIPDSFDQYLSKIGNKQRGNYRRGMKQLSTNHQIVTDTVTEHCAALREFDDFQVLHKMQWQSEGKLGHFGDWPKSSEFNRDLISCFGRKGMVRFFRIIADHQVASSQFCFVFRRTNYWRLPARFCKPEWDKLSLGKIGLIQMIEASIKENITTIEGGRGHYDYKIQLGGHEKPLHTLVFIRRGLGVLLRVRLFRCAAFLVNIVYYKILFCRLSTKFPKLRSSLRPFWIRTTW